MLQNIRSKRTAKRRASIEGRGKDLVPLQASTQVKTGRYFDKNTKGGHTRERIRMDERVPAYGVPGREVPRYIPT